MSSDQIISIGIVSMEVVNVHKLSSLVNNNLVFFILEGHELVRPEHGAED
jgi:hypothetical protein